MEAPESKLTFRMKSMTQSPINRLSSSAFKFLKEKFNSISLIHFHQEDSSFCQLTLHVSDNHQKQQLLKIKFLNSPNNFYRFLIISSKFEQETEKKFYPKDRTVRLKRKKSLDEEDRKIFIHNINARIDNRKIWEIFEKVGPLVQVRLSRPRLSAEGQLFRTGWVEFVLPEDGKRCVKMGSLLHKGCRLLIKPFKEKTIKKNTEHEHPLLRKLEKKNQRPMNQDWEQRGDFFRLNMDFASPQIVEEKIKNNYQNRQRVHDFCDQVMGREDHQSINRTNKKLMNLGEQELGLQGSRLKESDLSRILNKKSRLTQNDLITRDLKFFNQVELHKCTLLFGKMCPSCYGPEIEGNHHQSNIWIKIQY
jgi:hypothetical protein